MHATCPYVCVCVSQVFEAKCVIKICMNDKVLEGAMRLLDNAEVIKQAVDLRGTCIALDDCYEVCVCVCARACVRCVCM